MDLHSLISEVDALPPTAQLLPKLQGMLRDEATDIASLASMVKVDVGLATEIVRVSNSAFFGGGEAKGLEEAINRLGFDEIYRIASTIAAKHALAGPLPFYNMASGTLWNEAIATAVLMENAAMGADLNADTAYTVGLLHAIGKLVINAHFVSRGMEVYGEEDPGPEMERKLLGWDHAQVGGAVLENWKFPVEVYEPIQFQFEPSTAGDEQAMATLLGLTRDTVHADAHLSAEALTCPSEEALGQANLLPDQWETALEDARLALESLSSSLAD